MKTKKENVILIKSFDFAHKMSISSKEARETKY